MKQLFKWAAVLVILILVQACTQPEVRTVRSVGATSEILVVTQTKQQWDGKEGEAIRSFFGQDQFGLPQSEPLYRIANITISNLSDMFKKHRNILIVEYNKKLKEPVVEMRSNLWAQPQRVFKITAPDADSWVTAFDEQKVSFLSLFNQSERERLINIYRPTADYKVIEEVEKTFGFKLLIPEGFYVAKNEGNFMWIRKELIDYGQGLILYTRPYRDTVDLNNSRLIYVRDSLLFHHIPGPVEGSFMSTEKEYVLPQSKAISGFNTSYTVETRGLWNVVGDFMAGPFLAYTVVDETLGRLITVEGYVYAPGKDKRDFLRQLEAILYTFELPQKESDGEQTELVE
jgi:hypothetical protein